MRGNQGKVGQKTCREDRQSHLSYELSLYLGVGGATEFLLRELPLVFKVPLIQALPMSLTTITHTHEFSLKVKENIILPSRSQCSLLSPEPLPHSL